MIFTKSSVCLHVCISLSVSLFLGLFVVRSVCLSVCAQNVSSNREVLRTHLSTLVLEVPFSPGGRLSHSLGPPNKKCTVSMFHLSQCFGARCRTGCMGWLVISKKQCQIAMTITMMTFLNNQDNLIPNSEPHRQPVEILQDMSNVFRLSFFINNVTF